LDILSSDTLGFTVIRRLTEQLEAELNVLEDVPGFGVELILPKV
jgi:two-component sensor histidine kinase